MLRLRRQWLSLVLLLLAPAAAAAQADSTETVPVTADASPAVRLAFYDLRLVEVPRDTVDSYDALLQDLSQKCHYSDRKLARVAISGSRLLTGHGVDSVSARRILGHLDDAARAGPYSNRVRCGQVIPSVIANLTGDESVPELKIRNALRAMQEATGLPGGRIPESGGGGGG